MDPQQQVCVRFFRLAISLGSLLFCSCMTAWPLIRADTTWASALVMMLFVLLPLMPQLHQLRP